MKLQDKLAKVQGHLERLEDPAFDQLDFDWEGIQFHARAEEEHDGGGKIHLSATLGRLYFTVENAAQRAMAIERVYTTNRGIDGAYQISRTGDVRFNSVTLTDQPLTGSALMGALTLILLEAETHLRALRSHLKPLN
ncbi:MAG: hypothetical protein EP335_13895 [Alphaproteobacteria bacterium]|nr:MAG: hypothetical protein EP335_13895 [Alphaproteobacteria bacterium]